MVSLETNLGNSRLIMRFTVFEKEEDKNNYITKMKTDKVYGAGMEVETFSNIFKIKIVVYTRYINDNKNLLKIEDDKFESIILGNKYEGNFALMLDKNQNEIYNHYSS